MDIKSLRLGNYVMYEQTTHVVTAISRTLIGTHWPGGTENYIHLPDELDPIPLTEEILLKCGFEKDIVSEKLYKKGDYQVYFAEKPVFRMMGFSIVEVEFLHELQNVYFATAKKELEYGH